MEKDVISFFKNWGIYNNKLKNKTIINGVKEDPLDLENLFESFFREFNIENSYDFDVSKYFYQITFINKILLELGFEIEIQYKPPITIGHMLEVAKKNKWFDPSEN